MAAARSEEQQLTTLLQHESPHVRNRAQIVLLTMGERSAPEIADEVGLSAQTVIKWQRAWEKEGLSIFPEDSLHDDDIEDDLLDEDDEADEIEAVMSIDGLTLPRLQLPITEHEAVQPHDTMSEAGRKVLLKHFEDMLENELPARVGEDIEGVHKMRVATRRMRSAYNITGAYLDERYFKKIPKPLRHTARLLGAVRDLDVFTAKTQVYIDSELGGDSTSLDALFEITEQQHQGAYENLLDWLDDKGFDRFVSRFAKVLRKPAHTDHLEDTDSSFPISYRVDHLVPGIIYTRYEAVRRYEIVMDEADTETLHSLRIEVKRLRYTLEFFSDVLGDEAQTVIKELKLLQDLLGDMNDAFVADGILKAVIKQISKSERDAVKRYRNFRRAEIATLAESFPAAWERFNRPDVREALALAVAKL